MILPIKGEYSSLLQRCIKNPYYQSYTSEGTVYLIKKLFTNLIDGEVQAEKARRVLNSKPYFSSFENFELLKDRYMSYAAREDLSQFLINHGYRLSNFELDLLFKRLDKNRDYQITFNEFVQEILPKSSI